MTERYKQQMLAGDRRSGFRNSSQEDWRMYATPPNGAVLNFAKDGSGYEPKPGWIREGVTET